MGKTNNPHGRPKGTPNKVTRDLREALAVVIDAELSKLPELFEGLSNRERAQLLVKLLPYVIPKLDAAPYMNAPGEDPFEAFNLGGVSIFGGRFNAGVESIVDDRSVMDYSDEEIVAIIQSGKFEMVPKGK